MENSKPDMAHHVPTATRTMDTAPRFSVIVPVYNRRDEVADLMESLRAQTCRDGEVVGVEDGSTSP